MMVCMMISSGICHILWQYIIQLWEFMTSVQINWGISAVGLDFFHMLCGVNENLWWHGKYPLRNQHYYGKTSFFIGKSTVPMAMFNSEVLPGRWISHWHSQPWPERLSSSAMVEDLRLGWCKIEPTMRMVNIASISLELSVSSWRATPSHHHPFRTTGFSIVNHPAMGVSIVMPLPQ